MHGWCCHSASSGSAGYHKSAWVAVISDQLSVRLSTRSSDDSLTAEYGSVWMTVDGRLAAENDHALVRQVRRQFESMARSAKKVDIYEGCPVILHCYLLPFVRMTYIKKAEIRRNDRAALIQDKHMLRDDLRWQEQMGHQRLGLFAKLEEAQRHFATEVTPSYCWQRLHSTGSAESCMAQAPASSRDCLGA